MSDTESCPTQMDYYLVGRECYNCESGNKVPIERCMKKYDCEYLRVGKKILSDGNWATNQRTGKKCLTLIGDMMKFDMSDSLQFPLLTTKKMSIRPVVAELLGFIKGYDNAADFREEGCKIWDANANESVHWLENPNRKGEDDLGRIYGVQARSWNGPHGPVDQLDNCVEELTKGNDTRRLIVNHWNPGELEQMALPPCHLLYQFCLSKPDTLDLVLYQRSCDFPIGIPFNIASYCVLLRVIANITGLKVGTFTHFMSNIHIYEDQLDMFKEQLTRIPKPSPTLLFPDVSSLAQLEDDFSASDFVISGYEPHSSIKYPFSA